MCDRTVYQGEGCGNICEKPTGSSRKETSIRCAKVSLVGAGPGEAGLITVKGRERIRAADVIIYDRLVNPVLLKEARADAELIYVGKMAGEHTLPQEEINHLLVSKAQEGKWVVRLKGGDPFIFGRGGEELEELAAAGIEFEVIPGITSAIAVPAYAGIPLTHRTHSAAVTFVTGHEDPAKGRSAIRWRELAGVGGTLVFLMGLGNLRVIAENLLNCGLPPKTPAAVVQWGTLPDQRTVEGTLDTIVQRVSEAKVSSPAVLVVGEVAALRERFQWFERKPLFGKGVLVTRPREQAGEFRAMLEELGARVYECPAISIAPPDDEGPLHRSMEKIGTYQWIIFTSVNGVDGWFRRLMARGKDARALAGVRLAAIGPATADRLRHYGLRPDYQPEAYVAEELAAGLLRQGNWKGVRVLLPRAAQARSVLPEALRKAGAEVDEVAVYRTVKGERGEDLALLFTHNQVEIITFTSSSAVRHLAEMLDPLSFAAVVRDRIIACIGPVTAAAVAELGGHVDVVAEEYTIAGMVQSLIEYMGR